MRILVVSQYYWPEVFRINDICAGLIERGYSVDVLTSLPNVPQGKFYEGYDLFHRGPKEHEGVSIERVGVFERTKSNKIMWALNCASFAINSLFHLPKLARKKYDAVFVFNNSPVTVILPAKVFSKLTKVPNIIYVLDIWPESLYSLLGKSRIDKKTLFYKLSSAFCKWLYKSADILYISSKGFKEKLQDDMGLTAPTVYFPNYAEEVKEDKDFTVTRNELNYTDEDFVIGFAGGMGPAQGIDLVISAVEKIKDKKRIKLLLMGDGTEFNALQNIVKGKNLTDKITFLGWVPFDHLPAYMRVCDVMMMCLKDNEVLNITVPAKLQTYMSCSKPVIAFMNGAGADVVNEANCGLSVKAEDVDGLADAFERLSIMDPQQLKTLGQNGKEYCDLYFEREHILDILERDINRLARS